MKHRSFIGDIKIKDHNLSFSFALSPVNFQVSRFLVSLSFFLSLVHCFAFYLI